MSRHTQTNQRPAPWPPSPQPASQPASLLANRRSGAGGLMLGASCTAVAITWLIILPWLAAHTPLSEHIERMDRQNIAVDAMFYTDLNWEPPAGAAWR